jgi:hypothetical protein
MFLAMARQKTKIMAENSKRGFSTAEVLRLFEMKAGRFQEWVKFGYIEPDEPAGGSGRTNHFSKDTLYIISIFQYLCGRVLNRKVASIFAKKIVHDYMPTWYKRGKPFFIVIDIFGKPSKKLRWTKYARLYHTDDPTNDLKYAGIKMVNLLNIDEIVKEVDEKIT